MSDINNSFFPLDILNNQNDMLELIKTNEKSMNYGLVLSSKDAKDIVETKNYVLKSYGRIEFGTTVINKIISMFCTSPYVNQSEYSMIISELIETFYYLKNETLDEVSDDELIELMENYFNNSCHGSIELLQGRELENFARDIRYNM